MKLTKRDLSTILAALRCWQRDIVKDDDIATDGGTLRALSADEIDALCEHINATTDDRNKITLDASYFEANGDNNDHLIGNISINGCPMHLEAVAVRAENDDLAPSFSNAPDWIVAALDGSSDYESVMTTTINGREYALIATPHCR